MGKNKHTDLEQLRRRQYNQPEKLDLRTRLQDEHGTHPQDWFVWVFKRLDRRRKRLRILDVGAGTGEFWTANAERLPPGWQVTACDLSGGMAHETMTRARELQLELDTTVCDAQRLPFEDDQFDVVLALGLYDHVPDLTLALREAHRVLTSGGRLLASVGGLEHFVELKEALQPYAAVENLGGAPERFGVENGARWLSPFFSSVRLYPYRDELLFSDADTVLAYLLSEEGIRAELDAHERRQLRSDLEGRLQAGPLRITRHKGLYVCRAQG